MDTSNKRGISEASEHAKVLRRNDRSLLKNVVAIAVDRLHAEYRWIDQFYSFIPALQQTQDVWDSNEMKIKIFSLCVIFF